MGTCRCPNADKQGQSHLPPGTGAGPPMARARGDSPRLYHMSLISKPICLLMSPYLKGRNRERASHTAGHVTIRPGLFVSATRSSIPEMHKEKTAPPKGVRGAGSHTYSSPRDSVV